MWFNIFLTEFLQKLQTTIISTKLSLVFRVIFWIASCNFFSNSTYQVDFVRKKVLAGLIFINVSLWNITKISGQHNDLKFLIVWSEEIEIYDLRKRENYWDIWYYTFYCTKLYTWKFMTKNLKNTWIVGNLWDTREKYLLFKYRKNRKLISSIKNLDISVPSDFLNLVNC